VVSLDLIGGIGLCVSTLLRDASPASDPDNVRCSQLYALLASELLKLLMNLLMLRSVFEQAGR
jgi:hypothetical protein